MKPQITRRKARAGIPPELIQCRDPRVQASYAFISADVAAPNTPEEFTRMTRAEGAHRVSLIRRLNLVAE